MIEKLKEGAALNPQEAAHLAELIRQTAATQALDLSAQKYNFTLKETAAGEMFEDESRFRWHPKALF